MGLRHRTLPRCEPPNSSILRWGADAPAVERTARHRMKLAQTATADVAHLIGQPRPLLRDCRRHGITRRVSVSISHDVKALDVNGSMGGKSNRPRPRKASVECRAPTPSTVSPLLLVAVQQGSAHRRTMPIRAPAAHVALVSRLDVNPAARDSGRSERTLNPWLEIASLISEHRHLSRRFACASRAITRIG